MASAAYGSWRSPVKAELLAQGGVTLSPPVLRPADRVFWLEARPAEAGRCVLVAARLPTNVSVVCLLLSVPYGSPFFSTHAFVSRRVFASVSICNCV